jgi:hypothetical protein
VKRHVVLVLVLLAFSALASAQEEKTAHCPTIVVVGPSGLSNPGDAVRFDSNISFTGKPAKLEYLWRAKSGKQEIAIVDGQGTPSITINWPKDPETITAEVEVRGLPEGCPNSAWTTTIHEWGPIADKLYQFDPQKSMFDRAALKIVAQEFINSPNNQLFVISASSKNGNKHIEDGVIAFLVSQGLSKDRMTIARVESTRNLFQFWRVPPGADVPKCDECKASVTSQQCPTITVTGRAGPTYPGMPYIFSANVSGNVPKNIRFVWTVSKGQILEGQGTLRIGVYHVEDGEDNLVATFKAIGLPKGCLGVVSATAPIIDEPFAVEIDQFSGTDLRTYTSRLKNLEAELRNNPNDLLFIIAYYKKETSPFSVRERVHRISEYLTKQLKLDERQFKIITSDFDADQIRVFRLPPGAEEPTP